MPSYHKSMSAFLCSLLLSSFCLVESFNYGAGITVDLYHRDSRHSPSYDPSNTRFQRLRNAFDRSFARKSALEALSSMSTDSFEAPISSGRGDYLMKFEIGTPPVEQFGSADTGSDLTWIQCKPCTRCYEQTLPLFDPSKTSSYRPVSCEAEQCAASGSAPCGSDNSCQYEVTYGDGSYSFGKLAVETLTFENGVSFPKIALGCGRNNSGKFSKATSGIVGLGGGSISIINQLQSSIGGKFSYCLVSLYSSATSKISFGSNAVVAGPNVVTTPLVRKSWPTFYYLTLEGFSVGTERLDYTASAGGEGNIIIDSGTTLTFIPAELYDRVESALESAVTGNRVLDPRENFKLCYEMGGEDVFSSPPITAHFKGADVVLPLENVFVEVEEGLACLAIVPSKKSAIFGNLQQMNYHIGYDLVKGEVSFLPTDCSKS